MNAAPMKARYSGTSSEESAQEESSQERNINFTFDTIQARKHAIKIDQAGALMTSRI